MPDRADRAEPSKPTSRRVVAIVTLWTIVMLAVGFASGCYGHNCDGDVVIYGRNPGEGHLISPDEWESTPIDGKWIDFPKARFWIFDLKDLGDRVPVDIHPYVSAQPDPNHDEGGNFAIAAGNLAEISQVDKGRVVIHNGTCADYSMRLYVRAAPRPSGPPTPASFPDAGGDAEAGP